MDGDVGNIALEDLPQFFAVFFVLRVEFGQPVFFLPQPVPCGILPLFLFRSAGYPFPQGAAACFVQLFLYPSDFALFTDAGHHVAPSEYVEHPVGIDPPSAQAFFAGIGNHKDAQAVFPPLFGHLLSPFGQLFGQGRPAEILVFYIQVAG